MDVIEVNTKTGKVEARSYNSDELKEIQQCRDVNYENDCNQNVIKFIRERYSIDDELAVIRQRDSKPDEFNEYFSYCEGCKLKAKNVQL